MKLAIFSGNIFGLDLKKRMLLRSINKKIVPGRDYGTLSDNPSIRELEIGIVNSQYMG